MSFALTAISLSGAVAGTTGSVDWTQIAQTAGFPDSSSQPHIQFFNESPCELQLNFSTGEQVMLPAGGWQTMMLNAQCTRLTYSVLAVLNATPIIAQLFGTWYAPGESVPAVAILGNSPIGGIVTGGNAQFLQGPNQTLSLTEVDDGGAPELIPGTGTSTDLKLGALNTLGNAVTLMTLDANGPTITLANDVTLNMAVTNAPSSNIGVLHVKVAGDVSDRIALSIMGTAGGNSGYLSLSTGSPGSVHRIYTDGTNVLFDGTTGLSLPGALAKIGNQATAGSFGAPVIVAQALNTNVATTAATNILVLSAPATGTYSVSVCLTPQNTSPRVLAVTLQWTDPNTSTSNAEFYIGINGSTIQAFNTTNTWPTGAGVAYSTMPKTIQAKTGTNITVTYQDTTGTPNDFVTAIIERLS